MKTTITAVQHTFSDSILQNGKFVTEIEKKIYNSEEEAQADFDSFSTIENKGKNSEGIIDTRYFSPSDITEWATEWAEDDDTTDDYVEIEIEVEIEDEVVDEEDEE